MTHTITATSGPENSITDISGLRIGQAHDSHANTGVTVIIPDSPATMGVDVRGGGPGTRETDALSPSCLVQQFHGLVFSGGSVFGLAAADQIVTRLSQDKIGLDMGGLHVPVVPSAILFDLKNSGDKNWGNTPPYRALADQAYDNLSPQFQQGRAGAGYGAMAGGKQGGIGSASFITPDGLCVAALVIVNSFGESAPDDHRAPLGTVASDKLGMLGGNTTLALVATNLDLDKAACQRLAIMGHDGLARAIRPLHTPFDGDSVFAMAMGQSQFWPQIKPSP